MSISENNRVRNWLLFKKLKIDNMEKKQQVLDLSKIDSKETAFLAGYQCTVWDLHCGWHKRGKKLLDDGKILINRSFMHDDQEIFKDFIESNFSCRTEKKIKNRTLKSFMDRGISMDEMCSHRYTRRLYYYEFELDITEGSKSFIGNKLPTVKKEFYPYLLLGLFTYGGSSLVSEEDTVITISTSKNALSTLKKQLVNWYGLDESKIGIRSGFRFDQTGKFGYMTIRGEENYKKFYDILPEDYLEMFKEVHQVKNLKKFDKIYVD